MESSGKRLILTADTANHFVLSLQRPEWEVRFDMDKAAAAATRKKVFDMVATDRVAFLGYHMPFPHLSVTRKKLDTGLQVSCRSPTSFDYLTLNRSSQTFRAAATPSRLVALWCIAQLSGFFLFSFPS